MLTFNNYSKKGCNITDYNICRLAMSEPNLEKSAEKHISTYF